MQEAKDLSVLIERIDRANQKQTRLARLQCVFMALAALCCVGVLVVVLSLAPRINALVEQAEVVMTDVQQVSQQLAEADLGGMVADLESVAAQLAEADWDNVVSNLEQITDELAKADLAGMAQDISSLVGTAQEGIEEAVDKLNAIDLEALNKAIQDLQAVIEPLADFVGLFGKK